MRKPIKGIAPQRTLAIKRGTIQSWRDCGWLVEGEHYFEEYVRGFQIQRAIKFYKIGALNECLKKHHAARIAAGSNARSLPEVVEKFGKKWVRESYVRRALGMSKATFLYSKRQWNKEGARWPILNPEHKTPVTIKIGKRTYYLKVQVEEEMKINLANLPTHIPENHPTLYTFEAAGSLVGFNTNFLRAKRNRLKHNLVTEPFWVRIATKWRGKTVMVLRCVLGFTRESFDDFLVTKAACKLPLKTIPRKEMARRLREASRACKICPDAVLKWCEEGLLDARQTDYLTETGIRSGWIVATESFAAAREALRSCGWDTAAATAELRKLRLSKRDDFVAGRLAERQLEADRLAKELAEKRKRLLADQSKDGLTPKRQSATDVSGADSQSKGGEQSAPSIDRQKPSPIQGEANGQERTAPGEQPASRQAKPSSPIDAASGNSAGERNENEGQPILRECAVAWRGGNKFKVNGKEKTILKSQADVIRTLIAAFPVGGLTKDQLETKSCRPSARIILKTLAESNPDWAEVILFSGENYAGGYRLKSKNHS